MAKQVDAAQINKAIVSSIPVTIKSFKLPHETEMYIEEVLGVYLNKFGQGELKDRIAYCMRELAVNAKKANTKRVYFSEKNLDINNPDDYAKGMESFKQETLDNINYWLEKQQEAGLYIKVVFHSTDNAITMSIKNNVLISQKEQMRVYDRIARSRAFESMEEALSSVLDDSEGAGLGIVILVLMLKKIGLDEDAFDIDVIGDETVARITIPFADIHIENLNQLAQEIVDEIDDLPQFPENVVFIQQLINDPESELTDIARQISMDPSLTADLLKVVNSAQFMLPKKVDNIVEAVKLVGLRGIRNMLFSYGTQKVLKTDQKSLWDHSYRVAFYSYNLAKNFKRKKDLLDDTYVGGILHDIGKIIFSNVHPELLEKISRFCNEKEFEHGIMEELSAGLNHAMIGGKIAEKWNFPPSLIASITYHHNPLQAPKEYRDVVYTVYLANSMANLESGEITFEQINVNILNDYGIKTEEQFMMITQRLSEAFDADAADAEVD
ncbi:MAG: HDOD domain-containing protein [Spirochaetales bacterium]|uniref:HDOD domain-containing protein n=1 Tax=Candidatus Thalassospirochaeta sargassi TaxID=3119039 RepID=A0AAJ1IBY7_9SPIO|nr:HDOD domain-containing protein [Spirochaetales bacterium]